LTTDVCVDDRFWKMAQLSSDRQRPSIVAHGRLFPGVLKIIAAILARPLIEKIPTDLDLQAGASPPSRARGLALPRVAGAQSTTVDRPAKHHGAR
jgi:hypothetical protein